MSRLELRHLRHFVAVAEELHFARAAERLGMEQSPLSQSIRILEADLGVQLFHRTTRRTWLTTVGARFYQDVRRILRDIEAVSAAARRGGEDEKAELVRLVLGDDLASESFTRFMVELRNQTTKIHVDVRELSHAEASRLVRDGGADVAFTLGQRFEPDLKLVRAWSERLVAVTSIGHAFAERDRIGFADLEGQTLALPTAEECQGYLVQIEALLDRHGVRSGDRRNVRHWNTAVSFAATGHAIALVPITIVHAATAVAVVPIAEQDAALVTWMLCREGERSPAVSLVLGIASEIAAEPYYEVPEGAGA